MILKRYLNQEPNQPLEVDPYWIWRGVAKLYTVQDGNLFDHIWKDPTTISQSGTSFKQGLYSQARSVPSGAWLKDTDDQRVSFTTNISAWVYFTPIARGASDFIFGKFPSNGAGTSTYSFGLYWASSGAVAQTLNSSSTNQNVGGVAITTGVPQVWAMTTNVDTIRLYINGREVGNGARTLDILNNNVDIGFSNWTAGDISMDVYTAGYTNTTLTPGEMLEIGRNPFVFFKQNRIIIPFISGAADGIKTINTIDWANVKTRNTISEANIKTVNTVTNP